MVLLSSSVFTSRACAVRARRHHRGVGDDLSPLYRSKTAIGMLPLVLILPPLSAAAARRDRRPARHCVLFAFELFSVGTVLFEPIQNLIRRSCRMRPLPAEPKSGNWRCSTSRGARSPAMASRRSGYAASGLRHRRECQLGEYRQRRPQCLREPRPRHRPTGAGAGHAVGRSFADRRLLSPVAPAAPGSAAAVEAVSARLPVRRFRVVFRELDLHAARRGVVSVRYLGLRLVLFGAHRRHRMYRQRRRVSALRRSPWRR